MRSIRSIRSGRFLFAKRLAACRCEIRLKISLTILTIAIVYATANNFFESPGSSKALNQKLSKLESANSGINQFSSSFGSIHARQLLQFEVDPELRAEFQCVPAAIKNYPRDPFTHHQRKHGLLLIHLFIALYMFLAVAIVCEEYFVPSLEYICQKLSLQEDVAGTICFYLPFH